ncbi:MAG: hypothetical protein RL032_1737, partial [Pseudomonadota bacterium]
MAARFTVDFINTVLHTMYKSYRNSIIVQNLHIQV